ncbi:hypothetical protein R1flu_003148 [Riccia fluitans]|uniref:DUF1995 domain-containing protein n=1 Tax=Riccia fluitans TaxID=41844 RepID=A0ABD1Y859_9MARC
MWYHLSPWCNLMITYETKRLSEHIDSTGGLSFLDPITASCAAIGLEPVTSDRKANADHNFELSFLLSNAASLRPGERSSTAGGFLKLFSGLSGSICSCTDNVLRGKGCSASTPMAAIHCAIQIGTSSVQYRSLDVPVMRELEKQNRHIQSGLAALGSQFSGNGTQYKKKIASDIRMRPKRSAKLIGVSAAAGTASVEFPSDYDELMNQVKVSTRAALQDSKLLMEIEFPTGGLDSVPGDVEGGIEMSSSMFLVREFCRVFADGDKAGRTRIFFPDVTEVESAKENVFAGTPFKLDYLTKPSGLNDLGLGKKEKMADHVQPTDEVFVCAYPYFNVNEMIAVEELYRESAEATRRPVIVFNGELDRIRSGYYPSFFYPKLGSLAKNFLPKFETAYYIHNFKGQSGGVLFRAYPGPWQVLRRVRDGYVCLREQLTMPTLKEVALNILPAYR